MTKSQKLVGKKKATKSDKLLKKKSQISEKIVTKSDKNDELEKKKGAN